MGPGEIPLMSGGVSAVISVQSHIRVTSRFSQLLQWPIWASANKPRVGSVTMSSMDAAGIGTLGLPRCERAGVLGMPHSFRISQSVYRPFHRGCLVDPATQPQDRVAVQRRP